MIRAHGRREMGFVCESKLRTKAQLLFTIDHFFYFVRLPVVDGLQLRIDVGLAKRLTNYYHRK